MKRVFFSHPYSNAPLLNLSRITFILNRLKGRYTDILFISPVHAFSYFNEEKMRYRDSIMEYCKKVMIESCEEVWFAGISSGCLEEIEYALELDKRVCIYEGGEVREIDEIEIRKLIDTMEDEDIIYTYQIDVEK
jgi:hypothetical protein